MENMNKPDKYVVLKLSKKDEEPIYKVFATWYGGYLGSDSWRMNSGIVKIEIENDVISFHGYSGSIYRSHINAYGTSSYSQGVLNSMVSSAYKVDITVEVMPNDTDWKKLLNEK